MHNIIVWSKDQCPQCEQAVSFLNSKNLEFEIRKIGNGWSKEDLLSAVPSARSVPQIFVDDMHIGGLNELLKFQL